MKHRIFLRTLFFQLVAGAVVWNFTLAVSAILGTLIGIRFWPEFMGWLWVGLVTVRLRNVRTMTPASDRVDLLSMADMLWKAVQWPQYLVMRR